MNLLAGARKRRELFQVELEQSGFVFDPPVEPTELSIEEINDLLALSVGGSTFTDREITRIA